MHGRDTLRGLTRSAEQGEYLNGDPERTPEGVADHRSPGKTTSDATEIGTG